MPLSQNPEQLPDRRLRRATALIALWDSGHFVLQNYLSGLRTRVEPIVAHVLDRFSEFRSPQDAQRELSAIPGAEALLSRFVDRDILLLEGSALDLRDSQLDESWRWGHEARFFHFATRDVPYESDMEVQRDSLLHLMREEPPPEPFKSISGARIPMSGDFGGLDAPLGETLSNRRTRRKFCGAKLPLEQFSCVLQWTWGKTHYMQSGEIGPYVLKTSPSGGARHSIEVYPLVARVDGLAPGIYHYSVRDHALELIRPGLADTELTAFFSGQPWLRNAAAVYVMTSIVARSHWKYRHSHAYRVLLLDAGHLGQTFHLVCTALGLAPFTLAGFDDTALEGALEIDGINEVVLYAAALGLPAT